MLLCCFEERGPETLVSQKGEDRVALLSGKAREQSSKAGSLSGRPEVDSGSWITMGYTRFHTRGVLASATTC